MVRPLFLALALGALLGCGAKDDAGAASTAAPAKPQLDPNHTNVPRMQGVENIPGGPIQPGQPGSEVPAGG